MSEGVVFWDFDGTLAQRPGLWSGCLLEVLDDAEPGHTVTRDQLGVGLTDGFPWHRPAVAHPELSDPDAWWEQVGLVIRRALVGAGISCTRAGQLAPLLRKRYIDPSVGWELFDDTFSALIATKAAGFRNAILSNHVPELAALVSGLGLDPHIEAVFTSAATGYEKPHPQAFRHALGACANPTTAFMVGDNPVADVEGARAAGLPAVLVRRSGEARYRAESLDGAARMIISGACL